MLLLCGDAVDHVANAAQPGFIGIAAQIHGFRIQRPPRGDILDLNIDVEDEIADLLHSADDDDVCAERAADVEFAAVAVAQILLRPLIGDQFRGAIVVGNAIHAALIEFLA